LLKFSKHITNQQLINAFVNNIIARAASAVPSVRSRLSFSRRIQMAAATRREAAPNPLEYLAALPTRRRNTILAYVNAIRTEELEDLAIFLKSQRPDSSDEDIAALCGVSRSKVANWERYQAMKPCLEDYKHAQRPPSKWRASNSGGRWPLDHPDGI
jgi:hypothetical protein